VNGPVLDLRSPHTGELLGRYDLEAEEIQVMGRKDRVLYTIRLRVLRALSGGREPPAEPVQRDE
jgi:hypothetical protein